MSTFYANNENAIEWLRGDGRITVTLSDRRLINTVLRLAKKAPDRIEILARPEDNGGYLYAHLPLSCLRIQMPPRTPFTTEEQREANRQRLNEARASLKLSRTSESFEQESPSNGEEV